MKTFIEFLRRRFSHGGDGGTAQPTVYLDIQVDEIRRVEAAREIAPGKRIHSFPYRELDIRLDCDVTGTYRITVHEGKERLYSFTVKSAPGDYEALRVCYEEITRFLDTDRARSDLPDNERLKGHFYGQASP